LGWLDLRERCFVFFVFLCGWVVGKGAMAASGLAKWASELAKGVHGYWANGRWTPLAISARHRARLRKETLLSGGWVCIQEQRTEFPVVVLCVWRNGPL